MEIRSIQKSGRMFYLYLPTAWCRKHKITPNAKITLDQDNEGNLIMHPMLKQRKGEHLEISVNDQNLDHLQKIIVACFLQPADSFKINLGDKIDFSALLKRHELTNMVVIEMDKKTIHGESSILTATPLTLLITLIRKIKNLLTIMQTEDNKALIDRFEEDIDHTKTLIEKSVISSFIQPTTRKDQLRNIDLHYTSGLSKIFERIVDRVIMLDPKEGPYFARLQEIFSFLLPVLERFSKGQPSLDLETVLTFMNKVESLVSKTRKSTDYHLRRIGELLDDTSEILIDWSITEELHKKTSS